MGGGLARGVREGHTPHSLSASNGNERQSIPSEKGQTMSVESIEELFIDELKDLYSAEKQITKSLPKMAKASSSPELKAAFESHLQETLGQIQRLEKAFEILGKSAKGKLCHGMKGVLEEGAEVLEETEKGSVRDAALISAAQRVEHYEMAGYGCVREYAKILGQKDIATLLDETLAEEKAADKKLGLISKQVNSAAYKSAA
jgi:ferritin-like metal-binding protein YciE